jgi:hypothetical protein
MIKPYTTDFASLSPADLRAARKIADAEVMAAEATLAGQRNKRDALKLEAFRRLHAKRIDTVIATIQADPDLRASIEALRGNKPARIHGPHSLRPLGDPCLPAWYVITGRDSAWGYQSDTDRKLIEIVLALIPVEPTPA